MPTMTLDQIVEESGIDRKSVIDLLTIPKIACINAKNRLKNGETEKFLVEMAIASASLFKLMAELMPNYEFLNSYTNLTNVLRNLSPNLTDDLKEDDYFNFLVMKLHINSRFNHYISLRRYDSCEQLEIACCYFVCNPLVEYFIVEETLNETLTNKLEIRMQKYKSSEANLNYNYEKLDNLISKHCNFDDSDDKPEILNEIKKQLDTIKKRLEDSEPYKINFFMLSTKTKVKHLTLLRDSVENATKVNELRKAFDKTIKSPEINQHRNLLLRCLSTMFAVRNTKTVKELLAAQTLIPYGAADKLREVLIS